MSSNSPKLVSFIAPVCNQGNEARETVASARASFGKLPHEIILVDDHSTDGCCHGMPQDVLIVRTPRRDGVSSARRCGAEQARGDVVIWSDPHCRFPPECLVHLAQAAAAADVIVQPKIVPSEGAHSRAGGVLALSERGLRIQRSYRRPAAVPALYGTVYAMKREVYDRLGGWPKLPGIWSYSEQALTLMAWFLGIPIVVDTKFTCIHKAYHENKKFPFSVHRSDVAANAHFVHAAFFPQTYPHYWRPLLDKHFGRHDAVEAALDSRSFRNVRRLLQRRATRSESLFFRDVLGMSLTIAATSTSPTAPVAYRDRLPSGDSYVRQQARRSRPQEYVGMRPRVDAALNWLTDQLQNGQLSGKRAIDAGTRDGYGVSALLERGLGDVEGLELVPATAQFAAQQGRKVRQGDMMAMPYREHEADLVTCIHALEHVPSPLKALKEFARVLRPGGWLYLVVPADESAVPERDGAHNCYFPDSAALEGLIAKVGRFDGSSVRSNIGKLAKGKRELRLLVRRQAN